MTLHAYECACERKAHAQPDSFAVTGVLCAIALVANMPHTYDDPCRLAHARIISRRAHAHADSRRMRSALSYGRYGRLYRDW
jgi:hypothetical protein